MQKLDTNLITYDKYAIIQLKDVKDKLKYHDMLLNSIDNYTLYISSSIYKIMCL